MTFILRLMFVLLIAGPGLTACCSVHRWASAGDEVGLDDLVLTAMVAHLRVPTNQDGSYEGTVIAIGENRFLTVRHILPEWSHDRDAPRAAAFLNGRAVTFRVVEAGHRTEVPDEDWAVIELDGEVLPFGPDVDQARCGYTVRFCAGDRPAPGTETWAVGYWGITTEDPRAESFRAPSWTAGRIIRRPWLIHLPDSVLPLEIAASVHALEGTSGGPVVTVDHERRTITVIGLYRGMRQFHFLGWTICGVHIAREIPDAAMRLLPPDAIP